ncbi:MAG: hypothetical protein LUG12_13505 [Erysipelotrichaceae bacterium]|nr:hypothetical protein [Erysipelotrichaceae bacterium]
MNKKIKSDYKFIIIIIIFCVSIILIGFYIYDKDYINSSQLSFLGSIIGGALTLCGVWWTINNNEKNRKEELIQVLTRQWVIEPVSSA